MACEPSVDRRSLEMDELMARCLGNLGFAQRVVALFEKHFDQDLKSLEDGLQADDMAEVARIAHRMKGASANAAAPQLCRDMAQIEELARQHRGAEMPNCVAKLREDWTQFRQATQQMRPRHAADGN